MPSFSPNYLAFLAVILLACTDPPQLKISLVIKQPSKTDVPVSASLAGFDYSPDSGLSLHDPDGNEVPVQQSSDTIYWLLKAPVTPGTLTYTLVNAPGTAFANVTSEKEDGLLVIQNGAQKLLGYQYETLYPPAGIDSAYQRSGFIHPVWTPHGRVITRIQPPDHYHHYGIWNPWTHTLFEGDTLDFWNLKKKEGTVRFAGFRSITEGPVYHEYQARHEHVAFKKDETQKVALNELQTVRVYQPAEDHYLVDLIFDYSCASESPFKILEYRYAGFGWRATEAWHKGNSQLLSSEGKTRRDADGTLARWLIVQGELDQDYGGAVMMSHPDNFNHPEPLRIWPEPEEGRGDVFACFCTTKNTDWVFEPGNAYTLRYRMVIFNDTLNAPTAESAWAHYASPSAAN